jgi:catechol 2,3-dioxygenase-like lactoylglutathione lyase family enzyme
LNDDMEYRLELVMIGVSDVDRAKAFYSEKAGFKLETDNQQGDKMRVVQLTPPGSACSIVFGTGMGDMEPGSQKGLQLCVADVRAAREQLAGRGVEVSEVVVFDAGQQRPAREGDDLDIAGFAFFQDPDGNNWAVQQMPSVK